MERSTEPIDLIIGEIPGKQWLRRKLTGHGHTYVFHLDDDSKPVVVGRIYDDTKFMEWFARATLKSFHHGRNWEKAKRDIQEEPPARAAGRAKRLGRTGDQVHDQGERS